MPIIFFSCFSTRPQPSIFKSTILYTIFPGLLPWRPVCRKKTPPTQAITKNSIYLDISSAKQKATIRSEIFVVNPGLCIRSIKFFGFIHSDKSPHIYCKGHTGGRSHLPSFWNILDLPQDLLDVIFPIRVI
jgi:hypothetical protein